MELDDYVSRVEERGRDLAETLADPETADEEFQELRDDYTDALETLYDQVGRVPENMEELVKHDVQEIEAHADSLLNYTFAVDGNNTVEVNTGGIGQ
jgi:F0F1-type ATP synthase membrane subunit b/b'